MIGRYPRIIAWGIATALTVASGFVYASLTDRWGPPQKMLEAGTRLDSIPAEFGKWRWIRSETSSSLDDRTRSILGCTGDVLRTYRHEETGEVVHMTLIVGPWGPISVHTPEVCFSSRDFKLVEKRKRVTIRDATGIESDYWAETFVTNDLDARHLLAYWAWSQDGRWYAPENARSVFAGSPHLFKIQLTADLAPVRNPRAEDPCSRFLKDFVPAAKSILTATGQK